MALTREEILHLAELTRMHLTDEEVARFLRELPSILEFVKTLTEVAADDVPPMTGGTTTHNIFRRDGENIPPIGDSEELREQFLTSSSRGDLIVPQIFDRSREK